MKQSAVNPFLPNYEYVPDGEPHVFGDRVYLYGSHDKFNGIGFCLNDYVCWSAPIDDLSDWKYEGIIYHRKQDPKGHKGFWNAMYAPDVCIGADGRYYLYYFLANHGKISVAVCNEPAGQYQYLGDVHYPDGTPLGKKKEPLQFDPGVFKDEDGKVYLYTGFGPVGMPSIFLGGHKATEQGPMAFVLSSDMRTIEKGPIYIGVAGQKNGKGTSFEGHEFFEASSMRKKDGKYYFIYSSMLSHELCYAVGENPLGPFTYGGTLISNGDVGLFPKAMNYTGNNHGSIENINGQDYIFYHRQTNRNFFSRQACAEKINFQDGKFLQAEMTSCGLNNGDLGKGKYGAYIACQLYSKEGTYTYGPLKMPKGIHPYFTQTGKDRNENPTQYIKNFKDGATAVYKYFTIENAENFYLHLHAFGEGKMDVFLDNVYLTSIPVHKNDKRLKKSISFSCKHASLQFVYHGTGSLDFLSFTIL